MERAADIVEVSWAGGRRRVAASRVAGLLSARRGLALALLAAVFALTAGHVTDPDFWWHLRTGQLIFETGAIPRADVFSFTAHGREWVAHEWLTEVLMYAVFRAAGWAGLVAAFSLVMTAALAVVYRQASRLAPHPFVAGPAVLLAALACAPMFGVRPQMISFLFTALYAAALDAYARRGRKKILLWLPPLMLLWANMHGGFALGLALVGVTAAGLALDELFRRAATTDDAAGQLAPDERRAGGDEPRASEFDASQSDASEFRAHGDEKRLSNARESSRGRREWSRGLPESSRGSHESSRGLRESLSGLCDSSRGWREVSRRVWERVWPLCVALAGCAAVVPLNPNGVRLFTYPLETITSGAMMRYIHEWMSPSFHQREAHAFALLLFVTFAALALSPKRARPGALLLACVAAYAGLRSWRNITFFAIVAAPLLAEHVWAFVTARGRGRRLAADSGLRAGEEQATPGQREAAAESGRGGAARESGRREATPKLILNALLFVVVPLGVCALGVARAAGEQPEVEREKFPAAAVEFLRARPEAGPVFNSYGWGGYLIWKLYPQRHVYIDGRADVYGDRLVEEFLKAESGEPGWRAPLEAHGVRTVLIRPDVPLASLLREDEAWEKVFEDEQAVIFFKR
jgi:hypothetical protein